jgi:hypothetical protein
MIFVPLCLITGFLITRFFNNPQIEINQSKRVKFVSQCSNLSPGIILVLFCLLLGIKRLNTTLDNRKVIDKIISVNPIEQIYALFDKTHERSWPEQKLINYIIENTENKKDYYNFYEGAYLYLESNKIPPISIYTYNYAWWTGWGSDLGSEKKLIEEFMNSKPSYITCAQRFKIPEPFLSYINNNYTKQNSYFTNYKEIVVDLYEKNN